MAKKASKGSQNKAEALTMRVNPKLKYGLELLCRKQHRTLTSVMERALSALVNDPDEGLAINDSTGFTLSEPTLMLDRLWDPSEVVRLIRLAYDWPQLMAYEEELIWKTICDNAFYWVGESRSDEFIWDTRDESNLNIQKVIADWETLKKVPDEPNAVKLLTHWMPVERKVEGRRVVTQNNSETLTEDDIPF
ncbi:hypothetical protein [Vampirovibrio sp.]|uniref:hypothetical protein n=1 Tax=Vampirovibrio sp. TaxID=2717857 RepID=UPI0035937A71